MELSPEEYGAYWRASLHVAAGVIIIYLGYQVVSPLLEYSNVGAVGIGIFIFVSLVVAGSFIAMLGVARTVRTAVDAEMRG
ncbi:hypothetical protein [Natronorubrum daqingense]|uniref:Uncharacterized protein n=1 Tax=Natronorubrum daqingense TaxID=588898 RepID=A0A1N7AB67_9EURY|nr:hypothetical protein [Natronorubrum daqingense]APX98049.1 hypothetical protein BB347_16305 [Natronorubrum daqingense]SIR36251.1 hypothetical protein SAMN05421809_1098 [Natronorubrum daqingense]